MVRLDVVLMLLPATREAATPDAIAHPIDEQPVSLIGYPDQIGNRARLMDLLGRELPVLRAVHRCIRSGLALKKRCHLQSRQLETERSRAAAAGFLHELGRIWSVLAHHGQRR